MGGRRLSSTRRAAPRSHAHTSLGSEERYGDRINVYMCLVREFGLVAFRIYWPPEHCVLSLYPAKNNVNHFCLCPDLATRAHRSAPRTSVAEWKMKVTFYISNQPLALSNRKLRVSHLPIYPSFVSSRVMAARLLF